MLLLFAVNFILFVKSGNGTFALSFSPFGAGIGFTLFSFESGGNWTLSTTAKKETFSWCVFYRSESHSHFLPVATTNTNMVKFRSAKYPTGITSSLQYKHELPAIVIGKHDNRLVLVPLFYIGFYDNINVSGIRSFLRRA